MGENLRKIGKEYELAAGEFLKDKGYQILEYNFRCRYSEIDIIAMQHDILVFCEVKYRKKGKTGSPLEAVNYEKQRRISMAALFYLTKRGMSSVPCRFDVIGIEGDVITHIENAFEYIGV